MVVDSQGRTGNDSNLLTPVLLTIILAGGVLLMLPNGMSLREQRLVNFEIFALIGIGVYIWQVNRWIGSLFLYTVATIPFHQAVSIEIMFAIACYGILFLAVAHGKWNQDWFWNVFCVAAIVNVAFQVAQYFGLWIMQIPTAGLTSYVGILSNTNETSAFLAITLPCFFRPRWKWLLPIPILGLFLSSSIGGAVAAGLVGLAWLAFNVRNIGFKQTLIAAVVILLIFGGAVERKSSKLSSHGQDLVTHYQADRVRYWINELAPVASMKPFGWGIGQFQYVMPLIAQPTLIPPMARLALYRNVGDKTGFEDALQKVSNGDKAYFTTQRWKEIWLEAHNEYLETWFALGIPGLALLLLAIGMSFKGPEIARYGLTISVISAIWFFSWQIAPIAIVTATYLGVIHGKTA